MHVRSETSGCAASTKCCTHNLTQNFVVPTHAKFSKTSRPRPTEPTQVFSDWACIIFLFAMGAAFLVLMGENMDFILTYNRKMYILLSGGPCGVCTPGPSKGAGGSLCVDCAHRSQR